jgi:hypothetical protein
MATATATDDERGECDRQARGRPGHAADGIPHKLQKRKIALAERPGRGVPECRLDGIQPHQDLRSPKLLAGTVEIRDL